MRPPPPLSFAGFIRGASSMTSLFISVVAASMRSPWPPDFASSRFALPLARRVPLLDASGVRIVGKKKPQHEQQIGSRLERFKLAKRRRSAMIISRTAIGPRSKFNK